MTHATDSDLEICAESGTPIVVCPRSNAFFGKLPDIPRLLRKKVTLMLGTDNAMISNPSLWDEMRFAYYTAKSHGEIDILDVFRMVLNSRKSLKGEGALGSTVGSKPDFVVLAPRGHDPTLKALLSASERDVSLVCTGDRVWRRQGTRLIEEGGN